MEEWVGKVWHNLITRAADNCYPEAAVRLADVASSIGILFRALGGDGALQVRASEATRHGAKRSFLQRVAGSNTTIELAWRDEDTLRLPSVIDIFPERSLNMELYRWLTAMAALLKQGDLPKDLPWLEQNQWLTQQIIKRYPGLSTSYRLLVEAELGLRPSPATLKADDATTELAIQKALAQPGSVPAIHCIKHPPRPVHLWLHPNPPVASTHGAQMRNDSDEPHGGGESQDAGEKRRRRAERSETPKDKQGLLAVRMESIFGQAEFVKVDRGTDEQEDMVTAKEAADDMEMLSITQGKTSASRIRFDLDLPSAAADDLVLADGILLPEWDYRKGILLQEHCSLQWMVAADAPPSELPTHLNRVARKLRQQFQCLAPTRIWHRAQRDGNEIDFDAYERFLTERQRGQVNEDGRLYRDMRQGGRELSCLLLADLSLSTDASVNDTSRVIDVIRDALHLFADALDTTRDQFALYGFSSRHRNHIRYHLLKGFEERYGALIRGRIDKLKPGYYTRMGAAIRQSSQLLEKQGGNKKLLLILTDGKPNDLDHYEGRYGVEDTRMAVLEAKKMGLHPFCVTIDREGRDYLPHIFGNSGYVVINQPAELPRQLPLLYAQLTH